MSAEIISFPKGSAPANPAQPQPAEAPPSTIRADGGEDILHACGHVQNHRLVGTKSDRDGKRRWFQERVCLSCFYSAQTGCSEDETKARAVALIAEVGFALPPLVGTERQIKWADIIRATRIVSIFPRISLPKREELFRVFVEKLAADAKYWIDSRDENENELLFRLVGFLAWDVAIEDGTILARPPEAPTGGTAA